MTSIYLDHNATTAPDPLVLKEMQRVATRLWANPSSVHRPGQLARAELDRAREAVASLCGMHRRDVTLTSGGTEANNLALWHAFAKSITAGDAPIGGLILSRLEHPSVVRCAEWLAGRGVPVRWLKIMSEGVVDLSDLERQADSLERVALLSVQAVNHETGVIQPIAELAAVLATVLAKKAHASGAVFHVDAVQAVGKLDREAWDGADLLTLSAHKIAGPKAIGAIVTRPGIRLYPLLRGGEQERGIRPGTQDASLAAGLAVAATLAHDSPKQYKALGPMRDAFFAELQAVAADFGVEVVQNAAAAAAPHVINASFLGWSGPELCAALDLEGVAIASGSACSAGSAEPSPVIQSMLGRDRAASAVRLSLGRHTDPTELHRAVEAFRRVLAAYAARS